MGISLGSVLGGVVSFLAGAILTVIVFRLRKRRSPRRMTVCPVCSAPFDFQGSLESRGIAVSGTDPNEVLRCTTIISESPFDQCDFILPRWLADVPWLRLGGVGGTCCAGQTTWNAACFSLIWPYRVTDLMTMGIIDNEVSHEVNRNWEDIRENRVWPAATWPRLSRPWITVIQQEGNRRNLAVAVFDVAGEVCRFDSQSCSYRQLLNSEAHLFFVDVVANHHSQVQEQLAVFHRILVNLRAHRGLSGTGQRMGPIAVIVSKCDLLPERSYGGSAERATAFLKRLRDSGPHDERATLRVIRNRSDLVLKYKDILPCVGSLEARLRAECGDDGFMFFPMTAIGFREADTDGDLRNRTIAPFAVLEPLLWLVHASGVDALPE